MLGPEQSATAQCDGEHLANWYDILDEKTFSFLAKEIKYDFAACIDPFSNVANLIQSLRWDGKFFQVFLI